jgi:hypothetical protein
MASKKPKQPRISASRKQRLKQAKPQVRFNAAIGLVERGSTLSHALKEAGISRRTFNKLNARTNEIGETTRVLQRTGKGKYEWGAGAGLLTIVDEKGRARRARVTGHDRQVVAVWQKSANTLADTRNPSKATVQYQMGGRLMGRTIRTVDGRTIKLSRNWQQIKQAMLSMSPEEWEDMQIYRERYAEAA